jgi:hypothetical protein
MARLRTSTTILLIVFQFSFSLSGYGENEVVPQTKSTVVVREHPRTGKSYVSIVSSEIADQGGILPGKKSPAFRPDYRMLDPKVKAKDIPYEGPYSSRKKVYIFAATLATVGAVGGTAIIAAAPVATTASAGGAGAYAAAGTAVAAGAVSAATIRSNSEPERINFSHTSTSRSVKPGSAAESQNSSESAKEN